VELAGSLATIATVLAFGAVGGLATPILEALALKSVTAAIAVELARLRGADPGLTAIFVVVTGTIGAIIGPTLLTRLRVTDCVARGVALGTISHAQGTAPLHEHEASGALGTLSFVGAALLTSLIAPLYVPLLLHLLGR
jgi:putative effector of murein hydrolase